MMDNQEFIHLLALNMVPGLGSITIRTILSYTGSAENVFKKKKDQLLKIPGIGPKTVQLLLENDCRQKAEEELAFTQKNNIDILLYTDARYPKRLLNCHDYPLMLFCKGNADLNAGRMVNIVGTRHATDYGKKTTEQIVEHLSDYQATVVSGLALGIDVAAHKACLQHNIPTIGVLGHGLDKMYPAQHKQIAAKMTEKGALLSEFTSFAPIDRNNFPSRNRIVAGMCDATIVVESAISGGALITAVMADSYNRDVFAVPGRTTDVYSAGCNAIIKENKAQILLSPKDITDSLGWQNSDGQNNTTSKSVQTSLFVELDEQEKIIVHFLKEEESLHIDELHLQCKLPMSTVATGLLNLEFKGVVKTMPGKMYRRMPGYQHL